MNLLAPENFKSKPLAKRGAAAFTLAEMMVAMALFSLVILAIIACQFAGLELNEFVRPKIENAQYARRTVGRLIAEVRCANSLEVGTGTQTNFTAATQLQTGNALRIYPSTNTSQFIYYFHDTASASMKRVSFQGSTAYVVATAVTNHTVFSMENFSGTVLTNSQNNAVMSVLLQMRRDSAWKGIADSYQVRAKITRRNIL